MKLEFQKTERIYHPHTDYKFDSNGLTEFLTDNFTIPDDNLKDISSFIDKDEELKRILLELPDLIKKEFPNDKVQIKFYEEFKQDELILEIGIFTSFDEKTSFEKWSLTSVDVSSLYFLESISVFDFLSFDETTFATILPILLVLLVFTKHPTFSASAVFR